MPSVRISQHAVKRYNDRVDRAASSAVARKRIGEILTLGKWRVKPRHWMSDTSSRPGMRFVYWAEMPGVCVIVVDGTAVTLITRQLTRSRRRPARERPGFTQPMSRGLLESCPRAKVNRYAEGRL